MDTPLYPLLFEPVYMDYIWGGTRIPTLFGRAPREGLCAESWEIADRPEGMSMVRNGPLTGRSLHDLVGAMGPALVGAGYRGSTFPLLIKIIDAAQRLSVQVHPNDETARRHGGEPKTEMWYILDGDADAVYYAGLQAGTDRAGFEQALAEERVAASLRTHAAKPDTLAFIPGGLVHAIGDGCLMLEIQQSSNTTYRVYDWDRVGKDGAPRALHIAQALQVIGWDMGPRGAAPAPPARHGANTVQQVVACPYFRLERMDLHATEHATNDGITFHALFVRRGSVVAEGGGRAETLTHGTSCLLPAGCPAYTLTPSGGPATVLRVTGPE